MTDVTKAILQINKNAEVTVLNNDINKITWLNGTTPISKAEIETKIAEMPTEEEERSARENIKASAKAKLISGEALTQEEADTIVL